MMGHRVLMGRSKRFVLLTPATWSTTNKNADITLSGGNLTATNSSGDPSGGGVVSSIGVAANTFMPYCEILINAGAGDGAVGICNESMPINNFGFTGPNAWVYASDGKKYTNNVGEAYGDTYANDRICVLFNSYTKKLWFKKYDTVQGGGDPVAGTGEAYTVTGSTFYVFYCSGDSGTDPSVTLNCGASAFSHTVPNIWDRGWGG